MKFGSKKIVTIVLVFLMMMSAVALLGLSGTNQASANLENNEFDNNFDLEYSPEQPNPDEDVTVSIESREDKEIDDAILSFQYKGNDDENYSDPGDLQMNSETNSLKMKGVIDGDYHSQPGITVRFWVNATYDNIEWIESEKHTYTVTKEGGWVSEDFSDNLEYNFEPVNPKLNESVNVTLEKKVEVDINTAMVIAEIDQPNSAPQEGSIEFENHNGIWKATIPSYPTNTVVDFYISAYDTYNQEIKSENNRYTVQENTTIEPLIIVEDRFGDENVDGAEVIIENDEGDIVYEGKTGDDKLSVDTPLTPGKYDLTVNYKGETKKRNIELTGEESDEEATFDFTFESKDSLKHGMISFPQEYVVVGVLGAILIPLFSLGFIYKKKEEKQIQLIEGKPGETVSSHPLIDKFWERIVKETGEPEHLIPVGFFLLALFGLSFIPFYPWWMIGLLAIVIGAVSYKYPYSSLLILSLFVTGSAAYQSPEFGLVMLVFSLLILLISFFDWKFGFLVFLIIFLARIGALYFVPVMSVVLFSVYLSVISTAVAGIFLVMLSSSSNFELLGFVTTSPHTTSFMRFDKPVVSGFKPSSLGNALASVGNANSNIITDILSNNFGASILPFFQILLWCIALYLIYLIVGTREPKFNKLIQWLKYPLNKDWRKSVSASVLLGVSPIFGLLYFDYLSGMDIFDILLVTMFIIGGVVLSFVSIGIGFMTKSLFREYYRSQLGISDVGTRIAEMADLGETPFKNVGGLNDVKNEVKESILMPLLRPDISEKFGVETSKGMMLYGPPGCGKTLLMKALATELDVEMINVKCGDVMSRWYGESEESMMKLFRAARERKPCIIFFDEIDAIAKKRDMYSADDVTPRLLSLLLSELDGMDRSEGIIMVGSTNKPEMVDPALLRPGRFDKIIYVPPPDKEERKEILKIHFRDKPLASSVDIDKFARKTEGFSGADIANLAKESATRAMRKSIDTGGMRKITEKDIDEVLQRMNPSITPSMKEEYERIKSRYERKIHETKEPEMERGITLDEIPDLEEAKHVLRDEILHPITETDLVREFDISGTKNLLLYGPKGCQKLSLLKAAGNDIGIPMRVITGMEFKEVVSEGGRDVVEKLFDEMRDMAPSVIVVTKIEKIASQDITEKHGQNVFESFLNLLKDVEEVNNVTLIGTSHYPDRLNSELFERGRFEKRMFIPEPNIERREELFEIHLDPIPTVKDIDYRELAELSENYTSDDIKSCIEDAKIKALSRGKKDEAKITQKDLEEAIDETQSSLKEDMIKSSKRFWEEWNR